MSFLVDIPIVNYFFPSENSSLDNFDSIQKKEENIILNIKIDKSDLANYNFINGCEKIFQEIDFSHKKDIKSIDSDKLLDKPENIKGILFEINSNGGVGESIILSNLINKIRNEFDLPVVSHIKNGYSAGYMLPSLISNRIFLSDGGYVGSVGGYVVEENYSEIFKKIGVDFHIYSSEGTSDYKFHNEFLPISKEINDHITQNLTNKMNKYFESLERIRPEVFKNKESLNFMNFKKGFDLSSDEAIELGLVDEIGELSDSLDFMKNLIFKKQGLKEFSIIKINNSSFDKKNKDSFGESQSYLQDLVLRSAIETLIQNKIRSDN